MTQGMLRRVGLPSAVGVVASYCAGERENESEGAFILERLSPSHIIVSATCRLPTHVRQTAYRSSGNITTIPYDPHKSAGNRPT